MNWADILRLVSECLSALLHRGYDLFVLLNLLNKFGKSDKCDACPFLSFFRIISIQHYKSTNGRSYLSYDIHNKTTFKPHF